MRTVGRLAAVLRYLPRRCAVNEFGILVYHRVAPVQADCARPTLNVSPDSFHEQITGLRRQGFCFLALRELLRRRAGNEALPPRTAIITFDDGFESIYEFAWPTLRDLNVPATVFVNTAYLGQQTPFPFDAWGQAYADVVPPVCYRPLTDAQCRNMADFGLIELGAHTHTHGDFRGRADAFRRDMQLCIDQLHERFGVARPSFALPFGKPSGGFADNSLIDVVRGLGLPCSLTTKAVTARLADSPYSWGRFNVYEWDTSQTLAAKLLGYYSWATLLAEGAVHWWKTRPRRTSRTAPHPERRQVAGGVHD
jgi:peptidoglycan/xylan/chitin deacetylase (PgdA/CDA1 family)